jgi:hypothetical protein
MFITGPAFIILLLLGLLAIWLYVELASLPGKKAKERNHPQAEAINVLGWIGPFLAGAGWAVALVWAYTTPVSEYAQRTADAKIAAAGESTTNTEG